MILIGSTTPEYKSYDKDKKGKSIEKPISMDDPRNSQLIEQLTKRIK